jgi:hypothetical protein
MPKVMVVDQHMPSDEAPGHTASDRITRGGRAIGNRSITRVVNMTSALRPSAKTICTSHGKFNFMFCSCGHRKLCALIRRKAETATMYPV